MIAAVQQFDYGLTKWLVDFGIAHPAFGFAAYFAAEYLILVMFLGLIWLWYRPAPESKHMSNRKAVVLALLGVVFAIALKTVIAMFILRARPFVSHPEILALPLNLDQPSFPSAHALIAATVCVSVWLSGMRRLGWILAAVTLLVMFGRVATGVHYPTDVLGGALLGIFLGWLMHRESSSLKRYLPNA